MIDKVIYEHLSQNQKLANLLTGYSGKPAVFNQEAPSDTDPLWQEGPQYPRIVFALDILGDPSRAMGGHLSVDVQCSDGTCLPEELEPVVRGLIDGYFFSSEGSTMSAQWEDSRYFTEPADEVSGVTLSFSLLAFPKLSTVTTDVTGRANEWTARNFPELLVINHDQLPGIWKPERDKCAVYWRVAAVKPAGWIPDTHQTVWRAAVLKGHVFAPDVSMAAVISQEITLQMYGDKRLSKQGESQIMVNRNNAVETGADALKIGQITVEATFGEIVGQRKKTPLNHINYV